MPVWHLSGSSISELLELPETGMGFQWVVARSHGESARFLVFNSEIAADLSKAEFLEGEDPSTILTNGLRVIEALKRVGPAVLVGAPGPHDFALLEMRMSMANALSVVVRAGKPQIAQSSSLVKTVTLPKDRVFHRYSAYKRDRRVDPATGSLLPGSYAVPESETPFIPTGFAAVGRLALPNVQPASFHYSLEAAAGTLVKFGPVAPAFGQAGGGVEAFFQNGAVNKRIPATPPTTIPDE